MKFGPVPLTLAAGKILGHNVAGPDGRRLLRKGKGLTVEDLESLAAIGRETVYVAELEPDDVGEDEAARRVASAAGPGLRQVGPSHGRTNLVAEGPGILRVDVERLDRINSCEGITVATLMANTPVRVKDIAATVKVIPFAVPESYVRLAEMIAEDEERPPISVDELFPQPVGMIYSGSPALREKIDSDFEPLRDRIEALGSQIVDREYIPLDDDAGEAALAEALCRQLESGVQLLLLAGETAIMDRRDIVPRALERAGGSVEAVGVPVDPGHLLMLGYLHGIPVLGLPGCARSRKTNVVDWILPRLLAGDHLKRSDLIPLGHGGLLEDTLQRPMPRAAVEEL